MEHYKRGEKNNMFNVSDIREALEKSSDGWWEWKENASKVLISKKLCELLNIEIDARSRSEALKELNTEWWKEYMEDNEKNQKFFKKDTKRRRSIETEYASRSRNGIGNARISKLLFQESEQNKNNYIYYVIEDITDEARKYKQITEKAFSDNLTGLANRALFEIEIEKLSAERWRKNLSYSLFMIDIDNFKNLNDTNGHVVGDLFLKEIGHRLRKCLRPTDFVARMGGDEFIIITKFKHGDEEDTRQRSMIVAEKVRKEISKSFYIKDSELNYQCSIGICIEQMQSKDPMSILDNADIALYEAKKNGGNKATIYKKEMRTGIIIREAIKDQIINAAKKKTIKTRIEKIVDISLRKEREGYKEIIGYEALFRCDEIKAEVETVIKAAEKSGQIRTITTEVIKDIGNKLANKELVLEREQTISINVSAVELLEIGFPNRLLTQLNEAGINSKQVYIEVTETALITNISIAKLNMKRLRKHGIKFAIDDFGTGYASISMLREISVERIKLDKTYIENIQNEVDQALVKTVVWMSKALNVELVAEGIESEEQMNALAGLGCKLGQGLWLE